jgi:hypothetical protein
MGDRRGQPGKEGRPRSEDQLDAELGLARGAWLAAGLVYGAIETRGLRRNLVSFEIPAD